MAYQESPLVDEYIARFGAEKQRRLTLLRKAVQATFPKAIEDISYGMPTFRLAPGARGVVHFAGFRGHVGLYGILIPRQDAAIHLRMEPYHSSRATLQFRDDQPFPMATIRQILAYHATRFEPAAFTKTP